MLAITGGGVALLAKKGRRSKIATLELPLPTTIKLPSAVTSSPLGPVSGFKLLEREAQHWPPIHPPKFPFGPKPPGKRNGGFLQPKRVKLPWAVVVGGMLGSQTLVLLPPSATEFWPPMANNAMLETVLKTGTSSPIRSLTKNRRLVGSTQLMSKTLNGPPGSPLGLCSGTIITSISPTEPFLLVPQTGQFTLPAPLPQLGAIRKVARRAAKARVGIILDFIAVPPAILRIALTSFVGSPLRMVVLM